MAKRAMLGAAQPGRSAATLRQRSMAEGSRQSSGQHDGATRVTYSYNTQQGSGSMPTDRQPRDGEIEPGQEAGQLGWSGSIDVRERQSTVPAKSRVNRVKGDWEGLGPRHLCMLS